MSTASGDCCQSICPSSAAVRHLGGHMPVLCAAHTVSCTYMEQPLPHSTASQRNTSSPCHLQQQSQPCTHSTPLRHHNACTQARACSQLSAQLSAQRHRPVGHKRQPASQPTGPCRPAQTKACSWPAITLLCTHLSTSAMGPFSSSNLRCRQATNCTRDSVNNTQQSCAGRHRHYHQSS